MDFLKDSEPLLKKATAELKKYEELVKTAKEKLRKAEQVNMKIALENQAMQMKIDENSDVIDYYEKLCGKLKTELYGTIFKQQNISLSATYYSEKMDSLKNTYLMMDGGNKTDQVIEDNSDNDSDLNLDYVTLKAEVDSLTEDISKNQLKIDELIGKLREKQATAYFLPLEVEGLNKINID